MENEIVALETSHNTVKDSISLTNQIPQYPHLQNLNPEQLAGVLHHEGPILVLAGAGTGKTRVLTRRIAHLVLHHRIFPSQILAVTFTNKASGEMKQRLEGLLGERAQELWISTFHSSALRILRRNAHHLGYQNSFSIFDQDDAKTIVKKIIEKRGIDDKKFPPAYFLRGIDTLKNEGFTPEAYGKVAKEYNQQMLSDVYHDYQRTLRESGGMDFGDLILNTLLLFKNFPEVLQHYQRSIKFLLVDEFQDTNKVQYALIKLLAGERKNVFAVGDDDQSIYKFRGADIENILAFEKDFSGTKLVTLEQNYRSTSTILEASHAVIEKNKNRKPKKLWTEGAVGSKIITYVGFTEKEEADFVAREIRKLKAEKALNFKECAVFTRTNAQTRALEEAFVSYRIPYKIFGDRKSVV